MTDVKLKDYQNEEREIVKRNRERVANALANLRLAIHALDQVEPETERGFFSLCDLARAQLDLVETHLSHEAKR